MLGGVSWLLRSQLHSIARTATRSIAWSKSNPDLQECPRMRLRVLCEPMRVRSCTFWRKLKEETEATKGETKLKGGHQKA